MAGSERSAQVVAPATGALGSGSALGARPDGYKWIALSNTTLGMLDGDDQLVDHPDRAARTSSAGSGSTLSPPATSATCSGC